MAVTFPTQVKSGLASNFCKRYGLSTAADNVASLSRVQLFVAQAGPSVLLTTLGNFGAFMIASLTPIAAVQTFCWQMSATVLILFTLLLLILVPLTPTTIQHTTPTLHILLDAPPI